MSLVDEEKHDTNSIVKEKNFGLNAVIPTSTRTLPSKDDSPYPKVHSAVANTDDPDIPSSTLRAWVLGIIFAIIIPGLNQFFFFRFPSVFIGTVAQLLVFPLGRAWARIFPNISIFGVALNPGPFTIKEHVLTTIMANVGAGSAYATDIFAVQRVFYNQSFSFGYQWMVMSTQLIGFSLGGVMRRFLVQPPSMIWPANLVTRTLFNTLHAQEYAGLGSRGGMGRERFFYYAMIGSVVWYFFPGYIFQALGVFNWVCWIVPDNAAVNQMFGYSHGMGMSLITFDWSQIAYVGSPLASPWWAKANVLGGFVFFWIIMLALHFSNAWFGKYMTISSSSSFDNTNHKYNVTKILKPEKTFDPAAYEAYSPLFLSTTFALSYGLSFASVTATVAHCLLYYRKQIWTQSRRAMHEQPDIHARLMAHYRQVPEWWYASLPCKSLSASNLTDHLIMFAFGVVAIKVFDTKFPVQFFILALVISFIYIIPIGIIQAITNQQVGLNVISELIIGYALPGRPVAMIDFKLGHYMEIAPWPMFWCRVIATIVAGTSQLGVQSWMFTNIPDMCSSVQKDGFTCPSTEVFGTASIIWGVIGPIRQFSPGQVHYPLVFFFLIGALCPVIGYLIHRKWPNSFIRYVNYQLWCWAIVEFIFQYVIRRRHFAWWTKYNYVLFAALDTGVAISIILILFCLEFPRNGTIVIDTIQVWWGKTVSFAGADFAASPLLVLAPGEKFGPTEW